MKNILKKASLLTLVFLAFQHVDAQISYGVKAGAGASNTTVIHGISETRFGFTGGGFVEIPLTYKNNLHYLQLEVLYANEGEYSKFTENGKKHKAFLNYINIPVLYKYYFDDQDSDFFIEAGPQVGFLVSKNFDEKGPEIVAGTENKFDLAINLGVGYSYLRKYEANLRYGYGLSDTYKTFGDSGTGVNRSSLFSLQFAYKF
ncbi:porin family protein [Weeksella sp. HMSC059D05]|uniref:porin family protein n=1 Tax=Weeksella sp. HMSC059D05 TaxID=1715139 RepID=UPI0008A454DE|nr:porin family protein [Weeksella sp. HMSC059D05]OFM83176.1 hypothetical protein HMPREF2660_02530 [Weeksella sp. HMSC059D05]